MYLSRVEIDSNNHQNLKKLSHLGAYHHWVESCFPTEIKLGERQRHLWRIDPLNGRQYLLLLSNEKPALDPFEQFGIKGSAQIKNYQPFLNKLVDEQIMRFRLTANPTYREAASGKVFPHITVEQQKSWLLKQSVKSGFKLITGTNDELIYDIVSRDWPILYHKRRIRLSRVTFEGILQITNIDQFRKALLTGIGREKAFGMGLLTVIPIGKAI
ncbi:type I-E CRISPR-associated protein Cas6/Cse3/CasE [Limosilactobacillus sp.]|uniref:type I-E CRISPR-associated protein Cas6/Cse3/CasE n=1 Tax=Limosilactobacillus sp. TaxID=2773925 RepID=UPI00345E115F